MYSLGELARLVGGELVGSASTEIKGIAGLEDARPGDITWAEDDKRLAQVRESKATAVVVPLRAEAVGKPAIRVHNPRLAFARLLAAFAPPETIPLGVHETAVIGEDVELGPDVSVQAHVVLGDRVRLGKNVVLYPGVYVGEDTVIGDDTVIYPNVTIRERVKIGRRVIIHSGTVVGADGFGYTWDGREHVKIPQIGTVIVEDDVELGANVTVDRATCGATVIGKGTKIDNLVQVAHNVVLGEHCRVVAQSGIAGSARLGARIDVGGQAGVVGHLHVGDGTVIAARGLVAKDLPPRSFVSGFPARPHPENMRVLAATNRLPSLLKTVGALEKRIAALEAALAEREATGP